MASKESHVYLAKLAEQAERYDEMVEHIKKVAQCDEELSVEERNLLSVAYKNVVGARRASWRIVSSIEQKEKSKGESNKDRVASIDIYRKKIEAELTSICHEIIGILGDGGSGGLVQKSSGEASVFYLKMKADYYRYLAEFQEGDDKASSVKEAAAAYEAAKESADKDLEKTNPIRLGLILNYSVFFFEVMGEPTKATELARTGFEDAIQELDNVSEESYKDSTLIMQLIRDNLTLWTSDQEANDQE